MEKPSTVFLYCLAGSVRRLARKMEVDEDRFSTEFIASLRELCHHSITATELEGEEIDHLIGLRDRFESAVSDPSLKMFDEPKGSA